MISRRELQATSKDAKPGVVQTHSKYPFRLNFYDRPPVEEITIEQFETAALDRLRVLAEIESCFARNRTFEEMGKVIVGIWDKYLPLHSSTAHLERLEEERRKDHIGHFVLRLAFCRSEDLRRRFVKAETTLFKLRYQSDDHNEREKFLKSRDFDWVVASPEEIQDLITPTSYDPASKSSTYYKVKWTRVPDLVEKRKVVLKGGMAYVPAAEQASIVYQEFQRHLEKDLEATAKALPRLDEDTRLIPILDNLSKGFQAGISSEWAGKTEGQEGLTADMIDEMAYKHYPACMRNLHMALRRDKHLKHFGRLQYGLFLKVLGLSIDEALAFWRKAFSTMQDDKFNKEYRYNIRHSYGLEGKRANYAAMSCQQILMSHEPGSGDSHGCPYRHFSADNLQSALLTMYSDHGLTSQDMPEIMHMVKQKHYHVACTRVFEITHAHQGVKKGEGVGGGESVTHPNQYAARSRELEKKENGDGDVVMQG
ncbi:DNA primase, large subunit [Dichomitus squalens LYAD-421 SS1]|uniref:DNA primase large subunit n=1 Tax=Dichomitus squalens TaxID=114155 RepID=A0A4Q9QDC1_9APHY|nr:DNA primase, large subunit [Dichomitus squalens LYAD-421 SS1]EJF65965.1 DNA primase, large subunit [Dichomitus squalens LYAD-421 SS1]TBU65709.1 DNA primase, large subunit [Dichomitus squalens]